MKLKSLALAISIIGMLCIALGSALFFSKQTQQDPSIISRCFYYSGMPACSFTTNTPPSGSSVLLVLYLYSSGSTVACPSGWGSAFGSGSLTAGICYQTSTSAITLSNFAPSPTPTTWALFEIDFISGTLSLTGYGVNSGTWCTGHNAANTYAWEAVYGSKCGYTNQMITNSFWLVFEVWQNVGGNINCYDAYCSVWSTPVLTSGYPVLVEGSAGQNNNGWNGAPISGNISAAINTGGGPVDAVSGNLKSYVLLQGGPVTLGGNNNGVFYTTITVSQTNTAFVAPSPTSIQYWIIPMFLILGVGSLLLMIGRYAGASGGDTFMLFMIGAWLGSIFGLLANIVPIAIVIVISIIMVFLIWRKVS